MDHREPVGVSALARYLAAPSLHLDLYPGPRPPTVAQCGTAPADPARCFTDAVATCIGAHEHVAVLYEGDLPSQVLVATAARQCRRDNRSLLVVVADGLDPRGVSMAARAQPVLAGLALGHTVVPVEADRWFRPIPVGWGGAAPGPRHTRFVVRGSVLAADFGATVVLSPAGGEELFGTPMFLGRRLCGPAARQYRTDTGLLAGVVAGLGRLGPRRWAGSLRLAASRLAVAARPPSLALTAKAQDVAMVWTADWVEEAVATFGQNSPAAAEAMLLRQAAVSERHAVASSGVVLVPRALPYLDATMVELSAGSALTDRYDARLPSAYQRARALLMRMVPVSQWPILSTSTVRPFSPVPPPPQAFPRCAAVGLVGAPTPPLGIEPALVHRLALLEDWLADVDRRA